MKREIDKVGLIIITKNLGWRYVVYNSIEFESQCKKYMYGVYCTLNTIATAEIQVERWEKLAPPPEQQFDFFTYKHRFANNIALEV